MLSEVEASSFNAVLGYLDKMGDENLLKGSYWTFRVIKVILLHLLQQKMQF